MCRASGDRRPIPYAPSGQGTGKLSLFLDEKKNSFLYPAQDTAYLVLSHMQPNCHLLNGLASLVPPIYDLPLLPRALSEDGSDLSDRIG